MSKFDFGVGPMCRRARANAARISGGIIFWGVSFCFCSWTETGASNFSDGAFSDFFSSGTGRKNSGNGILKSGFFVRKIIFVVAMYIGIAAKIKMPKTKPGKPRSWA